MALIEHRRSSGGGAGDAPVKQAEFEVLNVPSAVSSVSSSCIVYAR